jgi:hypothetical protein
MTITTSVPGEFVPGSTNNKVVALFDPSRSRRERVPTERNQPSEVTPIFGPVTMSIREIDCTIERLEATVRAQVRGVA